MPVVGHGKQAARVRTKQQIRGQRGHGFWHSEQAGRGQATSLGSVAACQSFSQPGQPVDMVVALDERRILADRLQQRNAGRQAGDHVFRRARGSGGAGRRRARGRGRSAWRSGCRSTAAPARRRRGRNRPGRPGRPARGRPRPGPASAAGVLGSSALIRHSIACPSKRTSLWASASGAPAAISICARTRSIPVIISVTGCSTWSRVFISMKYSSPS